MNEAIRQIHTTAMDLSELARMKKNTLEGKVYSDYLKAAYELEMYALSKMSEVESDNDQLWQASIIQSAGWLALKCGYAEQAKRLAEVGLAIPTDGYILSKLEKLKVEAKLLLEKKTAQKDNSLLSIYGLFSAADVETNQINIKEKDSDKKYTLFVNHIKMPEIARLFLGTTVNVEAKTDQEGKMVLQEIHWAA